jgi:hypothetical protein
LVAESLDDMDIDYVYKLYKGKKWKIDI